MMIRTMLTHIYICIYTMHTGAAMVCRYCTRTWRARATRSKTRPLFYIRGLPIQRAMIAKIVQVDKHRTQNFVNYYGVAATIADCPTCSESYQVIYRSRPSFSVELFAKQHLATLPATAILVCVFLWIKLPHYITHALIMRTRTG